MSEQEQTKLTPEQQIYSQLSARYKTPLRNVLGETQEMVQNTITNMIQQIIKINTGMQQSNQEVLRLQKILTDNKIDFQPPTPNREERRAQERSKSKKEKNIPSIGK